MRLANLLHEITQAGYRVRFFGDFEGMVTIEYTEENYPEDNYIRHEHLSYPGGSMDRLDADMVESLERFLAEIRSGAVRKDGLAP